MKMNTLTTRFAYAAVFLFGMVVSVKAETPKNPPSWPDSAPLTKQNVVIPVKGGAVRVDVLGERLFRIRHSKTGQWTESGLNRYGVLGKTFPEVAFEQADANGVFTITTKQAKLTVNHKDAGIALLTADGKALTQQVAPAFETGGGYRLGFTMAKDERIYGLGDASRENVMRRGSAYDIWVVNATSYIPIPMLLSNHGWGLLMNTTWRNKIDVGKTDPDKIFCTAARSDVDYYVFTGSDYRSLLDVYTSFTGRPALLPIWGYGLTYVCNQYIDAFNMINEGLTFRRDGIPCDVIGLEPGWMEKFYDDSPNKKWHPQRFYIPDWAPKGPHTFLGALQRKGFKLSLWLCCDYDLGVFEEELVAGVRALAASDGKSAAAGDVRNGFTDERLSKSADAKSKDAAKPADAKALQPWFEHLKKFVDQGASAFKLDGCAQVVEHPDRKWGNGMTDEEMHNLYPVIYAKQMARGFESHAQRRSMVYSASGGAGVQQYVATWAGDTGGGDKPLASMLNLALSGHSNHSCDMDTGSVASIHFGFMQTWAQHNNWDYWYQPWLLNDTEANAFREYSRLRYKLLPYLYSSAAEAAQTGYPVMRAMAMVYPNDPSWDAAIRQYMLGDFMMVSAFTDKVRLPDGAWFDFWSGKQHQGPADLAVEFGPTRGGAVLVKSGAIIPTWPIYDHVEKGWSPEVGLLVYPAAQSSFVLYEDDGTSLGYRKGQFTRTRLTCETVGNVVTLTIGGQEGSFEGMPAARNFTATIRLKVKPKAVSLDGAAVTDFTWDDANSTATVKIPACGKTPRKVICQ